MSLRLKVEVQHNTSVRNYNGLKISGCKLWPNDLTKCMAKHFHCKSLLVVRVTVFKQYSKTTTVLLI